MTTQNKPYEALSTGAIIGAWLLFASLFLIDETKTQGLQFVVACLFTIGVLCGKRKLFHFSIVQTDQKEKAVIWIGAIAVSIWPLYIILSQYFQGLFGEGQVPGLVERAFSIIPGGQTAQISLIAVSLLFLGGLFGIFFFVLFLLLWTFCKVIVCSKYDDVRQALHNRILKIINTKAYKTVLNTSFPWALLLVMFTITTGASYFAYLEGSDLLYHSVWAQEMTFPYITDQSYFLWHLGVKIFALFLPLRFAAAVFTGLVNTFTAFIVYKVFETVCKNRGMAQMASLIVMTVYPIWVYFLNPWINKPAATPNPWHNPTSMMVRPFAILAFYMFIRIYDRYKQQNSTKKYRIYTSKELILFPLVLILSNLAKPTFIQIFVPGLAVFLLIELFASKGKAFVFCVKIVLAFIPSACLSLYQLLGLYAINPSADKSEEAHMLVSFLHNYGGFGLVPILTYSALIALLVAFPVYVMGLDAKRFWRLSSGRLSVLLFIVGTLQHMFITEVGREIPGDNWAWGKILGAFIFWMVAMSQFITYQREYNGTSRSRAKLFIGYVLLALHILSGLVYLYWRFTLPNFWS